MANKTLVPSGKFKILTVGPTRNWTFKADNGNIEMTTYSVQLEGHESMWIDLNQKTDSAAPASGTEIEGSIEQDEAGKYAPKFKKASKGGGGWGGGNNAAAPGAIWSAAFATASQIVSGYLSVAPEATRKKVKSIDVYLTMVEQIAPAVKDLVDKHAGVATTTTTATTEKSESESGESPAAPAETAPASKVEDVEIQDLDESDLGTW